MPKHIQMPCYHSFFLYLVMFFMQLQGRQSASQRMCDISLTFVALTNNFIKVNVIRTFFYELKIVKQ